MTFEDRARAVKIKALLAVIPAGTTPRRVRLTADWLAALPQADRYMLAAHAKVSAPSPKTWALLVEAQRARKPVRPRMIIKVAEVRT